MNDTITFYTHPWSRGRVTRWMLEECQADYRTEILEYGTSMKSDEYLAINPMGKVPAIIHKDTVITENAAICMYLADAFPEKNLAPAATSSSRGNYYRWLLFTAGPLEAVATHHSLNIHGVDTSSSNKKMAGYGCLDDVVHTLETSLTGVTYICEDTFTTADLYLSACLNWFMSFEIIPQLPVFTSYVERHTSRPACIRAQSIDDELLKQFPVEI